MLPRHIRYPMVLLVSLAVASAPAIAAAHGGGGHGGGGHGGGGGHMGGGHMGGGAHFGGGGAALAAAGCITAVLGWEEGISVVFAVVRWRLRATLGE